jgi:hypothetical protein
MMRIDLKNIGLQLCTCIWIETMTGLGISIYLLFMQDYTLSALTAIVFAPLLVFHYVISRMSIETRKEENCDTAACSTGRRLHFVRIPV